MLAELREELDELEEFRKRDYAALADAQRQDLSDMESDEEREDDEALAQAEEKEIEIKAEATDLPYRPTESEPDDDRTPDLHDTDVAYLLSMEKHIPAAEKARYVETVKRLLALLGNDTTALPTSTL
jgi:cell division protein FtsN